MFVARGFLRESFRKMFLLFDYLLWLVTDPSKFKRIKKKEIRKVLLIHLGAIGEIVVTTEIIKIIKNSLNCEVHYLLKKSMAPVIEKNPLISKVHLFNPDKSAMIEELKKEQFDLAVIVSPGSWKMAHICLKAGIPYRVGGFGGLSRFPTFFYTRKSFPLKSSHALDRNIDIINAAGIYGKKTKTEIYLTAEERTAARKILAKKKIGKYAVIHPGFGLADKGDSSKLWPVERYAKVIDWLNKNGFFVIIAGTDKEAHIIDGIYNKVADKSKVWNAKGKFTIRGEFALLEKARLVIAPDTGMGHAAAAFGTPLVNLMSLFSPEIWAPLGDKKKIVNIYHPEGYEIGLGKIGKVGGLDAITVDEVINAVEGLLRPTTKFKR